MAIMLNKIKYKPQRLLLAVLAIIMSFACTACKKSATAQQRTITNNISESTPDILKRSTPYSSPEKVINDNTPEEHLTTSTKRAAKITKILRKIDGVNDASVVLTDKTALIGIIVENFVEEKNVPALKRSVEKAVLEADSEIDTCSVTTAPDLVQRIGNISGNATDGLTSDEMPGDVNMSDEFKSIIRRATPTI